MGSLYVGFKSALKDTCTMLVRNDDMCLKGNYVNFNQFNVTMLYDDKLSRINVWNQRKIIILPLN